MSDVMMKALQIKVESLTRHVETLGPENERVRKLLTEFDQRHDADQARIRTLEAELAALREARSGMSKHAYSSIYNQGFEAGKFAALEPAPVTVGDAARVLLDAWRNSQTIDADEKAQDYADIHECDVDAGRILEPWLRALADAGEAG